MESIQNSMMILEKEQTFGEITLPDFKICYETRVRQYRTVTKQTYTNRIEYRTQKQPDTH